MNSQNLLLHKKILLLFVLLVCFLTACRTQANSTYYVDALLGSDSNDGRSKEKPWASLEKVNATVFDPGEKLLLKAGTRYQGRLSPQGSGSALAPIIVDRYGEGAKPLIEAEGQFNEALLLENQEYWEINNLQLTNTGARREEFRYGVRVRSPGTSGLCVTSISGTWTCTMSMVHLSRRILAKDMG